MIDIIFPLPLPAMLIPEKITASKINNRPKKSPYPSGMLKNNENMLIIAKGKLKNPNRE